MAPNPLQEVYKEFAELGKLPTNETVKRRINRRYDDLIFVDHEKNYRPYVCSVCDEFIFHRDDRCWLNFDQLKKNQDCLKWTAVFEGRHGLRVPAVEDKFRMPTPPSRILQNSEWLNDLALSPRGLFGKKTSGNRGKWGVSCCVKCDREVKKGNTPLYAIVNNNFIGCPPDCLTELTEVELALITPVIAYGYCFSYVGGKLKNLKGTMTFLRVPEAGIGGAAAQMKYMGLNENIVVLLSGKMTKAQRKKAKQQIRTGKIIAAVTWLADNNHEWRDVDMQKLQDDLEGYVPIVIDRSQEEESENANVESREVFSCFFPEGSANETNGGFDNMDDFKKFVEEKEKSHFEIQIQMKLSRRFLKSSDSDALIGSCLLNFPYGVGAMDAYRKQKDSSWNNMMETLPFLAHLSKLSQPVFHRQMFQLILYSIGIKIRLFKRARLQLKGEYRARAIAEGLDSDDLSKAIRSRRVGNYNAGTRASKDILSAVNAVSKALPHTNEAAGKARSTAEAMMHHFATGSIFLTATFDDENSLLVLLLNGQEVSGKEGDLSDVTEKKLQQEAAQRHEMRLEFPGLAAVNFELLFDILCEEVIGWDRRKKKPTEKPGLFGECFAVAIAFEEQGRKTVHAHATLWIKNYRKIQEQIFFADQQKKAAADRLLAEYYERIVSTELFPKTKRELQRIFDHSCMVDKWERTPPEVITDEELRILRHRKGYEKMKGKFSWCIHCGKEWTYEQMVNALMRQGEELNGPLPEHFDEEQKADALSQIPKARMQAHVLEFQKDLGSDEGPDRVINALYQHHVSCHVRGCFKCNKKNQRKHTCGPTCECRYKMPDRSRVYSTVETISDNTLWYTWDGDYKEQPLVQFCPKRGRYDLFQNPCCLAISQSKFSCNSNVSLITDGPIALYQIKYEFKSTQDDDTAEYAHVEQAIKSLNGRVHEDNNKEAIRRICRAAFAHNKGNVVGPALASFLTRNGGRFYFSHEFIYCPLKDLLRLLHDYSVESSLKFTATGKCYFENQALHYLCRHSALEDVSAKDFYEGFEVKCMSSRKRSRSGSDDDGKFPFQGDTGYFVHPSAEKNNDGKILSTSEGVVARTSPGYIQVPQWMFLDTAKFGANIVSCASEDLNAAMDRYAENVLALLLPHRCLDDLKSATPFPFARKFQEVYQMDQQRLAYGEHQVVFTRKNCEFLQNIQNAAYNSLRYKLRDDDLARNTQPYTPADFNQDDNFEEDEEGEEEQAPSLPETSYEAVLDHLDAAAHNDEDPNYVSQAFKGFNFTAVRNNGADQCGVDPNLPIPERTESIANQEQDFVRVYANFNVQPETQRPQNKPPTPRLRKLVEVFLTRRATRVRAEVFERNPEAQVMEANGSATSILEWALAAKLDPVQKRAFECIISSFLLSFYNDAGDLDVEDGTVESAEKQKFRVVKVNLKKLKGGRGVQLICLVHGPGGSGKSTVINLVISYAREFCDLIGHRFTDRTIVVSAMSGVAATLLHGETWHSAAGTNRSKANVVKELVDEWKDTRMVIIDEISFASESDFKKMMEYTQILKQNRFEPFGGLNMVFAGDYSQLEPVGRDPIYKYDEQLPEFHLALNTYIELDGRHRFRDDPAWGDLLFKFRQGEATKADVDYINDHCFISDNHVPPNDVQVACYGNKERDAVNTAVFEEYCKNNVQPDGSVFQGAVMIFMDDLQMADGSGKLVYVRSNSVKKHFFSTCGESNLEVGSKTNKKRADPVLKLYPGCPMMMTENTNVPAGQANGSRVFVKAVHLRVGVDPFTVELSSGCKVRGFWANQVKSIELKHEASDIVPQVFHVKSKSNKFVTTWFFEGQKTETKMKGEQFPIISNSATTGHKLQGYTARSLLVNDWSYRQNWAYTVLSRVRKMVGLFLRRKLKWKDDNFVMPENMKRMIQRFRDTIQLEALTEEDYHLMKVREGYNN